MYLDSKIFESIVATMYNTIKKWPTHLVNSMNDTPFLILDVTAWCQLVHNTYSKLISTTLLQICTFVPKLSSQSWLQCTMPTHLLNSMNDTPFLILNVTEWCQLVYNTYSKLASTSLIQICTFLPKLWSKLWLEYTIPWNGQEIWLIQCMSLNFQS